MTECKKDVEVGDNVVHRSVDDTVSHKSSLSGVTVVQFLLVFLAGLFTSTVFQLSSLPLSRVVYPSTQCLPFSSSPPPPTPLPAHPNFGLDPRAEPFAGSTARQVYPPPSPTNARTDLFPTSVGFPGGTATGTEAAVIATAPTYPLNANSASQLVQPPTFAGKGASNSFDLLKHWSNLSPWYSVGRNTFGLDSSPNPPDTCCVTGLHLLHRHGARYATGSTSPASPAALAGRLNKAPNTWNASGDLAFLNDWTYKLGEELLTPFGRQQMFDLGVSMRMKYGFLLRNFTDTNTLPVFRTESQDRMLKSSLNFASGFFGYPFQDQYQQSITIEAPGINNTLAPYSTCPNANDDTKGGRGAWYVKNWTGNYLKAAQARLQPQMQGYELTIDDLFSFQFMCAYETVALGYSKFCQLFSEEEWAGFDYALDLNSWYGSAFGSPVARAQGIGYIQELVARLTNTRIAVHNSSTNSTLDDDPTTFPLGGQSLFVDATHDVVVLSILTALNLTNFARVGPLPPDHIPTDRSFRVSQLAPFGTNVQFQLLSCASPALSGPQIRIIINDGVTPLTGIKGCPEQPDGMCPLEAFIAAQKQTIAEVDWAWDCKGNWTVPEGTAWSTINGSPPSPPPSALIPKREFDCIIGSDGICGI